MIFYLLVIVLALLSFYHYFIKPLHYWSDRGINQTEPWPILGDSWRFIFRRMGIVEFIRTIYDRFPDERYAGFYQITIPALFIRDPELIKQIGIKDFQHFIDHRVFVDPDGDPLSGANLLSLTGQKWREMRATLSGTFTTSKMKFIYGLMVDVADDFVEFFLDKQKDLIEMEMTDIYTRYTNDVIATSAFGIKVDSLREPKNVFYLMGKKLTNLTGVSKMIRFFGYLIMPKLFKYFKISIFDYDVEIYFKTIINETIKTREEKGIFRPDMINVLLETRKGGANKIVETKSQLDIGLATVQESPDNAENKPLKTLTNDEIASQAFSFFFAGFDPISTVLAFGSYELAVNKDVQDKLRKEIQEINLINNGNITYDVLIKMKYLDMVVSEILRKWPPNIGTDRVCTKPYTIKPKQTNETTAVNLKIGEVIVIPIVGLHHDPKYYPNPNRFDPERFSAENKEKIVPYTYLPFGLGPRNCLGSRFALLEVKVLLFKLLLNFEIVPIEGRTMIPLKLCRKSLTTRAENGLWLGLKRADNVQ